MTHPYELWNTRRFLGAFRDVRRRTNYWLPWFQNEFRSNDEYIDFEKLPIQGRKLAAFVLPMGRGQSVYNDSSKAFRAKPAYIKLEDQVDPLKPLRRQPGIDFSMLEPETLTPMQRRDAIKLQIAIQHVNAVENRWDWMASKALIDGKITLSGEGYPTTLVDFGRAAGHTETLGGSAQWGDSGVSIVDHVQSVVDTMNDAEFGAMPTRITMGGSAWAVARKDTEFLDHMDMTVRGGNITIERGLVAGVDGEKIFKVGELNVGGNSGQKIELWVNNETYIDPDTGAATRYLGAKQALFTGTPNAVQGFQCFGRIIDPAAQYEALPIFPKNWTGREGDVEVEHVTTKSAPLMLPVNPNATFVSTVVA